MYSFKNDYSEGCHPLIIKQLEKSNLEQLEGYGEDIYCSEARELIYKHLGDNSADIHFIPGGTMSNLLLISSILRPHEAVISAKTGHIFVHETGAIEATGHKILTADGVDGKITTKEIKDILEEHHFEHMVKPALIYISQPTELGTLYSKNELEELYKFSRALNLYLFIDGARLGSALMSDGCDLTLKDYSRLSDAYYIGGTKNGAMFGEALVINQEEMKRDFRYSMKQRGALMAKGRFLGIQFKTLFEDDLYFELAKSANKMAKKLQDGIKDLGYDLLIESYTNQIFPILPIDIIEILEKNYLFYRWGVESKGTCPVRLITSWATKEFHIDNFLDQLREITQ